MWLYFLKAVLFSVLVATAVTIAVIAVRRGRGWLWWLVTGKENY